MPQIDRSICRCDTIVYVDDIEQKIFQKEQWGEVATRVRGEAGPSIDRVAVFNGKSISEHNAAGAILSKMKIMFGMILRLGLRNSNLQNDA